MGPLINYVLRQKVRLANGVDEWIDIATFTIEMHAWTAFDKIKSKGASIHLIKKSESRIGWVD